MTNKEIIELLKEQLRQSREQTKAAEERERKLLQQISELIARIASLEEALLKKGESLEKQKRITRGLSRLMESSSEKQVSGPLLGGEELKRREEERKAARKARGNNGARHDMHHELETVEHDVYPDNPDFDLQKARPLSDVQRVSVRYEFIPMRFIKHVYSTHQIRVHMASLGHPLLGDVVYGSKKPWPGLAGQCLHARKLRFIHPATGKPVELECPLPDWFERVLRQIDK